MLPAAQADTLPPEGSGLPATVSADALPTWQLTGVVWSQVVVGNVVYATGNFTKARPSGMWKGGPTEIDVAHLFAYDIRTGDRIASFDHALNAQGLAITASPDGTRVYVGGDFTAVDGQARQHVAAFDTATGDLVTDFAPAVSGAIRALDATENTLYVGGAFESAGGKARKRLASFTVSNGGLTSWAPTADDGYVWSLAVTPDGSKVVAGGQFTILNGTTAQRMGALDATTGARAPWKGDHWIPVAGTGAVGSLTTDGSYIYGSSWNYQGSGFEGTFSLNPNDGSAHWLVDCLGDSYDIEAIGDVVYTVSHAHDCSSIDEFPQNTRRWQRALAFTRDATGVNKGPNAYGGDYSDVPAPSMLHWYPELGAGTTTGQYQAAWTVAGTSKYVALAGEFPSVNGKEQYGLTRFAVTSEAPNKVRPQYETVPAGPAPTTTATSNSPGVVNLRYNGAWDKDNEYLTYQIYRDRGTATELMLYKSQPYWSNFWTRLGPFSYRDQTVPAGSHTYQVRITDGFGNELWSPVSDPVSVA